jgi:hypothetical protein
MEDAIFGSRDSQSWRLLYQLLMRCMQYALLGSEEFARMSPTQGPAALRSPRLLNMSLDCVRQRELIL